jgi:hypothetical protein
MTEVESPEETVILTYCHHEDEDEGNECRSTNSDEHSSSLRSCEQPLETGVEGSEGGDELTTDILTWPSFEEKIDNTSILHLPTEEEADSFSDCAFSVGENEGIEYCLSDIIQRTNTKDVSDPSYFKVQSPSKLFAAAFGKRIKKVPLQQKMLIPDSLNDIHNNHISTPKDSGTNGAAAVDHQEKSGSEMTLSCDVEAGSEETSLGIQATDYPTNEETSLGIQATHNPTSEETSLGLQAADNPSSFPLDNCNEQLCIPNNPTLVSHSSAKMKGKAPEDTVTPRQPSQEAVDEPLRGILRNPTIISRSNSEIKEITPSEPYNNGLSSIGHNPTIISRSNSNKTTEITPSEPNNNEPSSIAHNPTILLRSNSSKLDDPPLDDSWKQQISLNPLVRTNRGRKMKAITKKHDNQLLQDPRKPQIQSPKNIETTVFIRPTDDPLLDDLWKPQNISHQKTFVNKIYGKGWLRKKRTSTQGIDELSERRSLDTIGEELLLEPSCMIAQTKDLSTTQVISKEDEDQVKKYPIMASSSNNDTDAMDVKIDVNLANDTFQKSPTKKDAVVFHSPNTASSELDILSSCFCGGNDYSTVATTRVHSMDEIGAQGNRNVTPTEPIGEDCISFTVESTSGLVKIYPASKSVEADNDRVESKPSDGIIHEKHTVVNVSSDTSSALSRQDEKQGNEGLEQFDMSKDSIPSLPDCHENAAQDDCMAPMPSSAAGDSNKPPHKPPKNRFKLLKFASNSKRSSERSLWMKKKVGKEKKQDNDTIIPSDLTKRIVIYESPTLEPQGSAKQFKEVTPPKASRKKALPPGMSGKRDHLQSPNAGHSWDESTGISFFTVGTADVSFDTTLSTVSVEEESDSSYGSAGESTHAYSDFHKNEIAPSQCDGAIPNLFTSILKQIDQIFDCAFDTTTKSYNEDGRSRK